MRFNLFPPAVIHITADGFKDYGDGVRQAGTARGPLVTIRPEYEADTGLLAHELTHVLHWWLYGLLATALIALAGWLSGNVEIAGIAFPAWAVAPLGMSANSLGYALWPEWREAEEIAAYRAQAACYPDDRRPLFARFLAERYGLSISADEALRRLEEGDGQ